MLEINQIHHGDCLELMWDIPDHSIDMVLADLPYGTTACAWDSIIDLDLLWGHYKRIIKPAGAIVLTASQPFTTVLINAAGLDWLKYELVWDKGRGFEPQLANIRPQKSHENVLIFANGKTTYNPQMIKLLKPDRRKASGRLNNRLNGNGQNILSSVNSEDKIYKARYPLSVVSFQNANQAAKVHPTQKPVALFAYLINTYSNPGDLVLDNAAGSGTTAIAAIQTGRNWLCIENDAEIYATSANRIAKALGQSFTPAVRCGSPTSASSRPIQLGFDAQG